MRLSIILFLAALGLSVATAASSAASSEKIKRFNVELKNQNAQPDHANNTNTSSDWIKHSFDKGYQNSKGDFTRARSSHGENPSAGAHGDKRGTSGSKGSNTVQGQAEGIQEHAINTKGSGGSRAPTNSTPK